MRFSSRRPFAQVNELTALAARMGANGLTSPRQRFATGWAAYGGDIRHRHSLTTGQFKIETSGTEPFSLSSGIKRIAKRLLYARKSVVKLFAERRLRRRRSAIITVILEENHSGWFACGTGAELRIRSRISDSVRCIGSRLASQLFTCCVTLRLWHM